ncbi:hypothetical protein E3N88_02970 [Mikania micrantha]|uniref:Uncharacterized protein n=1 Tax=Mikania micrantha TaxID=192012 RepID=A0A5N6Q583_9ASTR|nr:hypothetical protein E3N88_02970 [Mikania micrantha]
MQTPSSSSSSSSPISPSHSSVTLHSILASSTDSSSSLQSSSFQPSSSSPSRCFGLNLLVKAIHQVTAGSVVGVPYIQRRILTRRRRPIHFNNLIISTTDLLLRSASESNSKPKSKQKTKRQRRVSMTMPSKYRDSVLQPLTPKRRSERSSSIKIIGSRRRWRQELEAESKSTTPRTRDRKQGHDDHHSTSSSACSSDHRNNGYSGLWSLAILYDIQAPRGQFSTPDHPKTHHCLVTSIDHYHGGRSCKQMRRWNGGRRVLAFYRWFSRFLLSVSGSRLHLLLLPL